MCGRFTQHSDPHRFVELFGTTNPLPNLPPNYNLAPAQKAAVVRRHPETGEKHLDPLVWGLVPRWVKDLKDARKPINARAETIATSSMFKSAFKDRRCLVPADEFFEWKAEEGGKAPFAIALKSGGPMAFAGLWEGWKSPDGEILRTFTIITTEANAEMRQLHDRMPVILEPGEWDAWLGEGDHLGMLNSADDGQLRLWPVSKRVNTPRNNDAELIASTGEDLAPLGGPNPA